MESMEKHEMCHDQSSCGCACGEAQKQEVAVEKTEAKMPRRAYVPAVDIVDSENSVELVVDIPGVAEGGVELTVEKNILTLSAVPADGVIAGKKLAYAEYGVGEYRRSFALSEEMDQEHISASLKNGVLRIHLPKTTSVARKISIAAS